MRCPTPKASASAVAGVLMMVAMTLPAGAGERINKDDDGLAILGYDPVAYFTEGEPVEGSPQFEQEWRDSTWRFSSARHRDLFAGDPERYAPRYGGFCAGGMASGWVLTIDPNNWAIVDGKLYLAFAQQGRDRLRTDPQPIIAKADANWERLGRTE